MDGIKVYRTTVRGLPSEVLFLPAPQRAARHVLFLPGDVQMRRAEMDADLRGGTFEWSAYSLDDSLPALQAAFDPDSHVWCLRPARMVYQFACYQQFASVNLLGAAECARSRAPRARWVCLEPALTQAACPSRGAAARRRYKPDDARAGAGLTAAFGAAAEQAEAAGELRAGEGMSLPLALVGFSKGAIVLNQLVAELGAREPAATALCARVAELHFVDGGNGLERGAFPLELAGLDALARESPRMRVCCHSTPYMLRSPKQPWIGAERAAFVQGLAERGVAAQVRCYFENEPPSLQRHFELLAALKR